MPMFPAGTHFTRLPNRVPVLGYFWRLFTSVRFALLLISVLAIGCFLGVIISQVPIELSGSRADVAQWMEQQARPRYGNFTNVLSQVGLFDVFHAPWFRASLVLLTVAIVICTLNRFPAIYQTTVKAKPVVATGFVRSARYRSAFTLPAGPEALVSALRHRRYRVTQTVVGNTLHLYADKNGWAKYLTFVSHLGLIMFMFGGMLTNVLGYQRFLVIPDGQSLPIYSVFHPEQMQVLNRGFTVEYYEDGRPKDYYSDLTVFKGGQEVASGRIRVNEPMDYGDFRFHQNSFGPTVALEVRKADDQQMLFSDTMVLGQAFGMVPFDTISIPTTDFNAIVALTAGNTATDIRGGTYVRGGEAAQLAVMGFSGDPTVSPNGQPDFVVKLAPGQTVTEHGLTFKFDGIHYFSGVVARKDPGATFIWLAAFMFVPALWVTFWMSRRRIWVQITNGEAHLAGMADRFVNVQQEIDAIVLGSGGQPTLPPAVPPPPAPTPTPVPSEEPQPVLARS